MSQRIKELLTVIPLSLHPVVKQLSKKLKSARFDENILPGQMMEEFKMQHSAALTSKEKEKEKENEVETGPDERSCRIFVSDVTTCGVVSSLFHFCSAWRPFH